MELTVGVSKNLQTTEIALFKFTIIVEDRLILPAFKGSTLRGGFGEVLRKTVCSTNKATCEDCIAEDICSYKLIFEGKLGEGRGPFRLSDPPRPFVFEPMDTKKQVFQKDEVLSFQLNLVGEAIRLFPLFLITFTRLGQEGIGKGRHHYRIENIEFTPTTLDMDKLHWQAIPKGNSWLKEVDWTCNFLDKLPSKVKILNLILQTPLRIKVEGKLVDTLHFSTLMSSVIRRITLLGQLYSGLSPEVDYRSPMKAASEVELIKKELTWWDWERYSSRQDSRMKLGGIVGAVTYLGDLDLFLPWLALAQYLHVGKGATFGLGKIKIEW